MDSLYSVVATDASDGTRWIELTLNNRADAWQALIHGKSTIPQLNWEIQRLYTCDIEYALYHIDSLQNELFESAESEEY
jgi:hypothetical protein